MNLWRVCLAFMIPVGLLIAALPGLCLPWFSRGDIVLPFRTIHGFIVARMSLDGKPGHNFIIDTGAATTVLDSSAVGAAGLRTVAANATIHSFAGDIPLSVAVPQVTILGYGLQINGAAGVSDMRQVQKLLQIPLTGIIGSDTITSRPVLVDYQTGKITMFLGKGTLRVEKAAMIPLESQTAGEHKIATPVIAVKLKLRDGRLVDANLEIDTGNANALTLHFPFASRYGLLTADPSPKVTRRVALGGSYSLVRSSVPALFIGNQRIGNPETLCDENPTGVAGSTVTDGEIGYGILSHFRVLIDAQQHFAVFERQEAARR